VKKKFSVLIYGPGRGQNISIILEQFNNCLNIKSTIITQKYFLQQDRFANIKVVEFFNSNKILKRIIQVWKLFTLKRRDILYIQGGTSPLEVFLLVVFGKYRKLVFNVWGEAVVNKLSSHNLAACIYKFIFNKSDIIQCNWNRTYNILIAQNPRLSQKAIILPWGLSGKFLNAKPIQTEFVKDFLNKIPAGKIVMLNMRSISEYNEIEKLLHSISILKDRKEEFFENLLLVFWPGNNTDIKKEKYIKAYIQNHDLNDHVWYVEHPFLPDADIRNVIERSDIVMNLVKHDQLSYSILEAMYLKKEMISSNITPYKIFNEQYNLQLSLVENKSEAIANEIKTIAGRVKAKQQDNKLLEYRKNVIKTNFFMDKNFMEIISMFERILS